jgi:hypothetical protein
VVLVYLLIAVLLGVALLMYALRRGAAPAGPARDPAAPPAEPVLAALGPQPPQITPEAPTAEPDAEVLRAIPPDSTEWLEGEQLEIDGINDRPLRPVSVLLDALHTGDAIVCAAAVEELVRHGAAAVPLLEGALQDEDPDVRVDAAKALAAIRANQD